MKKVLVVATGALIVGAGVLAYRHFRQAPDEAPGTASAPSAQPAGEPAVSGARSAGRIAYFQNLSTGESQRWRFGAGADVPALEPVQAVENSWSALVYAERGWGGDDVIVWRNAVGGELRIWRAGTDAAPVAAEIVPYTGDEWHVAALGDTDADGDADLVWVDRQGGVAVWTLDAGKVVEQASVGVSDASLRLALAGDFDADGRIELIWRSEDGSRATHWTLQGIGPATLRDMDPAGSDWQPLGVVDLDGNAGDDVLWVSKTGQLIGWKGADPANAVTLTRPAVSNWEFAGAVDVDGDGRGELLWRESAGVQVGAWRLGEDGNITDVSLPPLDRLWTAVPRTLAAH